jgi:GMP synthase (glutamine-hydrolysing)
MSVAPPSSLHVLPPPPTHPVCVAILDAGAQYSKVIDRRVRELNVEAHILPLNVPTERLQPYAGVIISGGPQSVYGADAPLYDASLFTEYKKPILGICYGMQLMNAVCGGKVQKQGVREDGQFLIHIRGNQLQRKQQQQNATVYQNQQHEKEMLAQAAAAGITITAPEPNRPVVGDVTSDAAPPSLLYSELPQAIEVLLTHGDSLTELAPGFRVTATSSSGLCASIEHESRALYGVQYHPEVDLTPEGNIILRNFLERICKIDRTYTLESRKSLAINEIRQTMGQETKALCLVSGGVDSSVCAALLKEAIGADRVSLQTIDIFGWSGFYD